MGPDNNQLLRRAWRLIQIDGRKIAVNRNFIVYDVFIAIAVFLCNSSGVLNLMMSIYGDASFGNRCWFGTGNDMILNV